MITIQTTTCKIAAADGSLLTGSITLRPNGVWEYDEGAERRLVTMQSIVANVADGILVDANGDPTTISLAPSSGAGHDITDGGYLAAFSLGRESWTEIWSLPAGTSPVELTAITKMATTASATLPVGTTGPAGADGADGQGVPGGGTAGQVLEKIDATDYNTQWATPSGAVRVDLGAEVSDYSLAVGEEGYVDFAAALDVPLNVAVSEGQLYKLFIQLDVLTGAWSALTYLLPNDSVYAGAFLYLRDTIGLGDLNNVAEGFVVYTGDLMHAEALVNVGRAATGGRSIHSVGDGNIGGTYFGVEFVGLWNDSSTVWASLGTIRFPSNAPTGQIIVRRIR